MNQLLLSQMFFFAVVIIATILFFIIVFFYAVILLVKGYIDIAAIIFIYLHCNTFNSKYENRILC